MPYDLWILSDGNNSDGYAHADYAPISVGSPNTPASGNPTTPGSISIVTPAQLANSSFFAFFAPLIWLQAAHDVRAVDPINLRTGTSIGGATDGASLRLDAGNDLSILNNITQGTNQPSFLGTAGRSIFIGQTPDGTPSPAPVTLTTSGAFGLNAGTTAGSGAADPTGSIVIAPNAALVAGGTTSISSGSAGAVEIAAGASLQVSGNAHELDVQAGSGGFQLAGTLSDALGIVVLQGIGDSGSPASGSFTQTATGAIVAGELLLLSNGAAGASSGGTSSFSLSSASNQIGTLAGSTNADITVVDSVSLIVGTVTSVELGTTVAGLTAGPHNISLTADDMTLAEAIDADTGAVTLTPYTAGRQINIGTKIGGQLGLTAAELNQITAGTLTIGSGAAGDVTVSAAIAPAGAGNLALVSGSSATLAADVNVGARSLSLNAPNGISQSGGKITAGSVDANALAGSVSLSSATNAFGTITGNGTDSFTAVTAQALSTGFGGVLSGLGNISLAATGATGDIDVTSGGGISAASGSVTLSADRNIAVNDFISGASLILNTGASGGSDINVSLGGISDPLGSLITDANGTTHINGGSIDTTGFQTYHDAVTLGAATALTGDSITFNSTVDNGGFNLAITTGTGLFNGIISGSGGLTVASVYTNPSIQATITLSAVNLYSGTTSINSGTLLVDGSIASSSTAVNNGGTLGGHGTTGAVNVASGGTLSPGASAGVLNVGNLSFATGGKFVVELGGAGAGQYDQVNVTGTVALAGATLNVALLGGFDPAEGATFIIVNNDSNDAVSGTFAGLSEGSIFVIGSEHLRISYTGGTGNDVVLTSLGPPTSDFNADFTSDILWRHTDGFVAEWQMNSGHIASNLGVGTPGPQWQFQDAADFNADGRDDVLWRNDSGQVVIWSMNGNQIVGNQNVATLGNDWHNNGTGDFDGDGKGDVLWRNDSGQVALWTMNGATITSNKSVGVLSNDFSIQSVSDFNGDGKSDVLLRSASGQVVIWTMNGAQIVANQSLGVVGKDWHVLGTGDFDADGKGDILWRNESGQVALWTMNGATIASNKSVGLIGSDWHLQDVGDYNGDGRSDVLWRNDSGQVALWEMNGAQITANHEVGYGNQGAPIGLDWTLLAHHFDIV